MFVLVTYDVSTIDKAGRRRLARAAKTCLDYGQRAQNSVFECQVDSVQYAEMKKRLLQIIDQDKDSLRFYILRKNWRKRIEHFGTKPTLDMDGPLIA